MSLRAVQNKCAIRLTRSDVLTDGTCSHGWLTFLFLSPSFCNWTGFAALAHGATDSAHESDGSESDEDVLPGATDIREFVAKDTLANCRYPEEDDFSNDLDKNWRLKCSDASCPKDDACPHVFPREFRPPADLVMCRRCGMP